MQGVTNGVMIRENEKINYFLSRFPDDCGFIVPIVFFVSGVPEGIHGRIYSCSFNGICFLLYHAPEVGWIGFLVKFLVKFCKMIVFRPGQT